MKAANHFGNSHRRFPPNLEAKVIRCLIAFSMLTYGFRDGLTAVAPERPVAYANAASGQPEGKLHRSNTATAPRNGAPSQDRQRQAKDKEQPPEITNPFETLKLALEGNQLGASLTTEGVTEAIKKYKAAFAIFKSQDIKIGMAAMLFACGAAYYFLGQNREALSALLEASDYSKEPGFAFLRPFLDATLGAVYAGLGETSKALETLNRALPMVRRLNNLKMIALTLKGLGEINVQLGLKHKALEYLNEAAGLYRQTESWQSEVQVLMLISVLRSSLGQSAEALETARAVINRSKEKGDPAWEAQGHLAFAAAYAAAGNMASAITEYQQAAQAFQAQHDTSLEATALNNLGLLYVIQGELSPALDYFKKALRLYEAGDEPLMAGYALNNIGTIYGRRGDPVTAFQHFEKALVFARQHDDKRLRAAVLSSMADTYYLLNNHEYVLKLLKENAATFKELEEPARSVVIPNTAPTLEGEKPTSQPRRLREAV